MVPWSSGQDASLSRWNQGFDSPRHYQMKPTARWVFQLVELYYRGSRIRKGSGVSEELRRTPEQPLVQAAASVSGAAQDGGSAQQIRELP